MKIKVYNLTGKETGEMEISNAIFDVKVKSTVVHEVFVAQMNNTREPWAHTKNRGEVQGGGKKPWPQKGTGRARHGSIRSPIWKGGGVTYGKRNVRNYETKINKQKRLLATRMCLTDKVTNGALWVVENFNFAEPKTKLFVNFLKVMPGQQRSFIVLTDGKDETVLRITKNIPAIRAERAEDLTVVDLVNVQGLIASQVAIKKLETRLSK